MDVHHADDDPYLSHTILSSGIVIGSHRSSPSDLHAVDHIDRGIRRGGASVGQHVVGHLDKFVEDARPPLWRLCVVANIGEATRIRVSHSTRPPCCRAQPHLKRWCCDLLCLLNRDDLFRRLTSASTRGGGGRRQQQQPCLAAFASFAARCFAAARASLSTRLETAAAAAAAAAHLLMLIWRIHAGQRLAHRQLLRL